MSTRTGQSFDREDLVFCALVFGLPFVLCLLALGGVLWLVEAFSLSQDTMVLLVALVVFGFPKLFYGY